MCLICILYIFIVFISKTWRATSSGLDSEELRIVAHSMFVAEMFNKANPWELTEKKWGKAEAKIEKI